VDRVGHDLGKAIVQGVDVAGGQRGAVLAALPAQLRAPGLHMRRPDHGQPHAAEFSFDLLDVHAGLADG
jgi:hypothetical protein